MVRLLLILCCVLSLEAGAQFGQHQLLKLTTAGTPPPVGTPVTYVNPGAQNNGSSASETYAMPINLVNGNLLILHFVSRENIVNNPTTPSGWTQIPTNDSTSTVLKHYLYYKIVDGTEGSGVTVSMNGTCNSRTGRILQFTGNATTNPIIQDRAELWHPATVNGSLDYSDIGHKPLYVAVNDLGIMVTAVADNSNVGSAYTGGTGGTWGTAFTYTSSSGNDCGGSFRSVPGEGATVQGHTIVNAGDPDEMFITTFSIRSISNTP